MLHVKRFEAMVGEFTTVREEIGEWFEEYLFGVGLECTIEDFGDYFSVCFTDEEEEEFEVIVRIENSATTYYIAAIEVVE